MSHHYLDLSHTFTDAMPVYPGDSPPQWVQKASIKEDGYAHARVTTSLHVGTHIDAPSHFIENGKVLSEISLERFTGRGVLLDARGYDQIDTNLLEGVTIAAGDVILLHTGFSEFFGEKKYFEDFPVMTEAFARRVVELNVHMVGLDNPSPERDLPFPCHQILLGNEILILENLTGLDQIEAVGAFEVIAFPPKLAFDGSPVRVVAVVQD